MNQILEIYKSMLPPLGGYLVNRGSLHFERVQIFINHLAAYEKHAMTMAFAALEDENDKGAGNGSLPRHSSCS